MTMFLTGLRFLALTGLVLGLGTALARLMVLPAAGRAGPASTGPVDRALVRWLRAGLVLALLAGLGALGLAAAALAPASSPAGLVTAVWRYGVGTDAGKATLAQGLVILLILPWLGRPWLALVGSALALGLTASRSHALAMAPGLSPLMVSSLVHLLAAGAWLGALAPLGLIVARLPAAQAAAAGRAFSPLGIAAVLGLAASALVQGWVLAGGLPGLIGTGYGRLLLAKLALFLALLAVAVGNRRWRVPALERASGPLPMSADATRPRRALLRAIAIEIALGLAVLALAAVVADTPPGMHEQPVWPFAYQPSLVTVEEDPDFEREAGLAVAGLVLGLALCFRGLGWRRGRVWALAAGAGLIAAAVPHLDLLLVAASPTSFYHSPTGFAAGSIAAGAALYPSHCASCHGESGRGDGPAAAGLSVPPADLTAAHLWGHEDGELFGWLTDGIEAPAGGLAMPGFAQVLDEDQRWALIDYIRARNAGVRLVTGRAWSPALRAPGFTARCGETRILTLDDLAGQIVRLVFVAGETAPSLPAPPPGTAMVTILAPLGDQAPPTTGCIATDRRVALAYGLVAGLTPDRMAGSRFLIDGAGWLRAVRRPGEAAEIGDPELCAHGTGAGNPAGPPTDEDEATTLAGEIDWIMSHPIAADTAALHHHDMAGM